MIKIRYFFCFLRQTKILKRMSYIEWIRYKVQPIHLKEENNTKYENKYFIKNEYYHVRHKFCIGLCTI